MKRNFGRSYLLATAVILTLLGGEVLFPSSARAALVIVLDNGTLRDTPALTGFTTTGAMMTGISVTAFFEDATSEGVLWAPTGAVSGSAVGTGWSLSESGDTLLSPWTLINVRGERMTRLLIDAGLGESVFDTNFGGFIGTPGSGTGREFLQQSGPTLTGTATYRDAVGIAGNAPVGDLFRYLDLEFTGTFLASGDTVTYLTDTDSIEGGGDVVIPEPASIVVWSLLGLVVAFGWWRRRN